MMGAGMVIGTPKDARKILQSGVSIASRDPVYIHREERM